MAGPSDHRDRQDAMRMFVAVAIATLVLIGVGLAGFYFLSGSLAGWGGAFEGGLGLKEAAVIAFAISFVAIVILAVVSGGEAVAGELPFTLIGFFLFFVFCWLMLAWVF